MGWFRLGSLAVAGVVAGSLAAPARANDCCSPAPCGQTAYRIEYKQEAYTAYRCECVPVTKTRVCTVYKQVPEMRTETYTVCVNVPHVESRTVMQAHWTCKPVTCMVRRCVDRGHWECREVPCESRCGGWFHHRRRHHDCGCDSCCEPCCPPPTKTVRVWVPCKVWEECPVTRMQRVCEYVPVTCQVTVCRPETRQVQRQVCCYKCVPVQHTETYTEWTTRQVAYQATRCVPVCVPCPAPAPACCETTSCYQPCCETAHECCGGHHRRCGWRTHRRHHGCCESSGCCESAGCCH